MQESKIVHLTDGTQLEVRMNFGTIFYLNNAGGMRLAKRMQKREDKGEKQSINDGMKFAAKVIYALLRSNGRAVTFDEALALTPPDPTELLEVVDAYQEELEKIKKKERAKTDMKSFLSK